MGNHNTYRRSAITLVPHWASAIGLTLTGFWAAAHFGLTLDWAALMVVSLPLAWAAGQGLQWAAATWTITRDGNLIVQAGILSRRRQVIPLRALRGAHVRPALPGHWLDVGHLAVELLDQEGRAESLQWTWLDQADRLQQIISSRGKTVPGVRAGETFVEEYQCFLDFCQLVLAVERGACWPPAELPLAKSRRWMDVLRQARIVVNSRNGRGWRVADTIQCLDDVAHRVGQYELKQAMQRPLETRRRLRPTG